TMLAYAGASFRFDDKRRKKDVQGNLIDRNKRRMLVSFGRGSDGNVSVLRLIWDARLGYQVYRTGAKADPTYHYEYRRATLDERTDDRVRSEGKLAKTARRGRQYAIRLAGSYLERALARGEQLAAPSLTRAQYEELLQEMFEIADQLYAARQEVHGTKEKV
ncbi:MAG TPA: hypothetical protein VG986_09670, partial [Pseudolabrys sp.]|nr:hypothetical protein [Pseudolabrys sp.]